MVNMLLIKESIAIKKGVNKFPTPKTIAQKAQKIVLNEIPDTVEFSPKTVTKTALDKELDVFNQLISNCPENSEKNALLVVKKAFSTVKSIAEENNSVDEFCTKMEDISNNLLKQDIPSRKALGRIFYGELIKTHNKLGNQKKVIELSENIIPVFEKDNDQIHKLCRLFDIRNAYVNQGDKQNIFNSHKRVLSCIEIILKNFKEALKNYQRLSITPPTIETIEKSKAYTHSELAIIMAHEKGDAAKKHLIKAESLYKKYGMKKELLFLNEQFKRIKQSKMKNKLQQYSAEEMTMMLNKEYKRLKKDGIPKGISPNYTKRFSKPTEDVKTKIGE